MGTIPIYNSYILYEASSSSRSPYHLIGVEPFNATFEVESPGPQSTLLHSLGASDKGDFWA